MGAAPDWRPIHPDTITEQFNRLVDRAGVPQIRLHDVRHTYATIRPPRRRRFPGRKPVDDRVAPAGIVFVLRTGIPWNQLPAAAVGCSGVTCRRRLRDRTEAGVGPALHELLLAELRAAGRLDLDRCAVDASHVHALEGRTTSGRRRSTAATPAPRTT